MMEPSKPPVKPALHTGTLAADGFVLLPPLLDARACERLGRTIASLPGQAAGNRCLLSLAWCQALAERLQLHPVLAPCIPGQAVAVQCTLFEKSRERNWLVAIHQDLSIPVAARSDDPALRGWSQKEGGLFVRPPVALLQQLVAVRLHVDDCTLEDGPLRVVPGSHLLGRITPEAALVQRAERGEVVCAGQRGSALVMRPLLLHASSKAGGSGRRRVLHFVFGPRELPHGLVWAHARR